LRTGYTGNAIRVKRSSDNTQQDIGFDGEDLDVAALESFVGANTGYVVTFYDQSGNSRNLETVSSDGTSPRIIISGTTQTGTNGRVGIYFDSSRVDRIYKADTVALSATVSTFGDNTMICTYKVDTSASNYVILKHGDGSATPSYTLQVPYATDIYYDHGNNSSLRLNTAYPAGYFSEDYHVLSGRAGSTTLGEDGYEKLRFNGSEIASTTFTGNQSNSAKRFSIGANYAGGSTYNTPFKGLFQEVIIYNTFIGDSALAAIESNAITYYGT
jgi:hypothetical protein